ncbi:MAG: hypothetical protein M1828_006789 [Chrysothrix sp. TS-e1954]|nr:MAG: hypothetical protein M1828_006789 [Chrysothrix sp. TS-e1954]
MVDATVHPLAGLWKPQALHDLFYGPSCVSKHLLAVLPTARSKAFIITGTSLATKTPLISNLEKLLTPEHHAGTFGSITQHAGIAELDKATSAVAADSSIDTLISVGGGSPIDSAKAISYRQHEKNGKYLTHIAIPTTLSAAECTTTAGFTREDGVKTGVRDENLAVSAIFYDPTFAAHTPTKLWLSTGLRALDHAMELLYHPSSTEMPCHVMNLYATAELFRGLPKAKESHPRDEDLITRLFLAAYASLGFIGLNLSGGLGLSHALGYALGSPYGIPHGDTSCMTLGHVVKLKASTSSADAEQVARVLPSIGGSSSGDNKKDAIEVGDRILALVEQLGLKQSLKDRGVGSDQLETIASRATGGQTEGPVFDAVKVLVKGLY